MTAQTRTDQPAQEPPERPIALVTGASRGLGFALAEALAPSFHVVAVARTVGGLEALDDRIRAAGGSATLAPIDITVDAALQQLCRAIFERWGGLALWVHAAIEAPALSPADHIDAARFERALAVNVTATQRLIAYLAPLLRAGGGRALFFDDPRAGQKFFGAYGATKAAQMALARSWQAETARLAPEVLIASPPPMRTALRARFFPGENPDALARPAEVAAALIAEHGLA